MIKNVLYKLGYYNIKHFIKNFVNYRKFLWSNREWDYYYMDEMLLYKIKTMRDRWRANPLFENEEEYLLQMDECVSELKQIIKADDEMLTCDYDTMVYGEDKLIERREKLYCKIGEYSKYWWN